MTIVKNLLRLVNLNDNSLQPILLDEEVDRTLWGELESEEEEEEVEESEEEEGEDQEGEIDQSGLITPAEGLATPSGFSSVPAGLETPDMIELRKKKIEAEMEKYQHYFYQHHSDFCCFLNNLNLNNFWN